MVYDIAVIGAGAGGLMAAAAALEKNPALKLVVLEKNREAGKKLCATGNGHCNFLNINADGCSFYSGDDEADTDCFADDVLSHCSVADILLFLSNLGVTPSFEDEEGRLYPRSNQASSIVKALLRGCEAAEFRFEFEVSSLTKLDQGFKIEDASGNIVYADSVILAGGGKAGIQFGSDGRCYKFAEALGHTVIKPVPALVPLVSKTDLSDIAGVRCRAGVYLLVCDADCEDIIAEDSGEVQFNKDSISGICTMNLSRFFRLDEGICFKLGVDLFPEYTDEELESLLQHRSELFDSKEMLLESLIPDKLADHILKNYSFENVKELGKICKFLKFELSGTKGWPDAQTTSGGVKLSEIEECTMESKLVRNLFFCGEVADIDGLCGGYNLTWAFASGYVAGHNAAER